MSRRRKSLNLFQHLYRFLTLLLNSLGRAINLLTKGLLKTIQRRLPRQRNRRVAAGGFVLPTIVMVSLVVVLVTTAVMIRSFDRSKNASNFRVNEAVLNAATPALDRARAKITRLFSADETNLPVGTPLDIDIRTAFEKGLDNYTFQDEDKLELSISGRAKLKTAWRYPVDSNNNGKFDSYTLYGIYFNDPTVPSDKDFNQASSATSRTPLDARSAPMDDGQSSSCSAAAGSEGSWRKSGSGVLKKAFFTYVATVPISKTQATALGTDKYEEFVGNQGFSALEMQQDQSRLNLDNNAVFYQDDLEVSFAPRFFINGRVHTNGNLMVSSNFANSELVFLQVSSPESCFYKPENSEISVGGNVAAGGIFSAVDDTSTDVKVHLFFGPGRVADGKSPTNLSDQANKYAGGGTGKIPSIDGNTYHKTTYKTGGREVAYNDQAYQERLRVLTSGALNLFDTDPSKWESATSDQVSAFARFPQDIKDSFKQKYTSQQQQPTLLRTTLESYFAKRIRRVPFAEIPVNSTPDTYAKVLSSIASERYPTDSRPGRQFIFTLSPDVNGVITAPKEWMLIEDPSGGATGSYTKLDLQYLEATDPTKVDPQTKRNDYLGDRVVVGNNLPYQWFNDTGSTVGTTKSKQFAKASAERPVLPAKNWLQPLPGGGSAGPIQRSSKIVVLDDIADTGRGGFWEGAASSNKTNIQLPDGTITYAADDTRGGLRVITGAGIYIDGCPTEAPASGSFPTGFPCNGTKGLGLRESDSKATVTTIRSFLPQPPQFQVDPNNTGAYRLSPSPPNPPYPNQPTSIPGEDYVRVKLPAISGATLLTDEKPITVWSDAMPMWSDRNLDGKWDIAGWHKSGLTLTDIQDSTTNNYKLDLKGDLQMRASVVYHYNSPTPDVPLACVSSYYDPSNFNSANASDGLTLTFPDGRRTNSQSASPSIAGNATTATNGRSYSFDASWQNPSGDDLTILQRQAAMVFPTGRLVNEPLRIALLKKSASTKLTIADQAAIDAAMCSLKILDGTATASSSAVLNGSVKEATLVDARQIKAIHKINYGGTTSAPSTASDADAKVNSLGSSSTLSSLNNPDRQKIAQTYNELTLSTGASNLYNLPIEQRQPLEVRVTELDIELLRTTKVGSGSASGANDNQEYLLPNSGIIYATRDDALPDLTSVDDSGSPDANTGYRTLATMNKTLADKASATDFKLDATRNPNGIRLIRGSNISRQNIYRQPEKGLTLATNIPVYLRADSKDAFNLHATPGTTNTLEEFNTPVNLSDKDGGNFYDRVSGDLNNSFACRTTQAGCVGTGDQWRAARIIADAITLLSNNFYDGVRSDSSFDQNNNGGNYLVEPRLKNGFLWNGFGTSSDVANVVTPDATKQSSYWTNGVTPIQRRVSGAAAYQMEICLKLPVVACQPQDWKQTQVFGTGSTAITIKAGDTATLPSTVKATTPEILQSIYRFPRRVAFPRNPDGTLQLIDSNNNIVLGSTKLDSKSTKLIIITPSSSTNLTPTAGSGIIPATKYTPSDAPFIDGTDTANNRAFPDLNGYAPTTPNLAVVTPSSTATTLWFGSGTPQTIKKLGSATSSAPVTLDADVIVADNKANSGSTSYYQQYVITPNPKSPTNKGVALPQFFPDFPTDIPGINAISDASKYSFCIGRPPSTTTDQPATGSGASQQVIVRTQVLPSGTPAYVPPNTVPTKDQSTLPIPLVDTSVSVPVAVPFPALAIKPFEPYQQPYSTIVDNSTTVPVYGDSSWKPSGAATIGSSYPGIDSRGATTATTTAANGFAFCATATADALDTFRKSLVDPASPVTGDIVFNNFTTTPTTVGDLVTLVPSTATTPTLITITAKPLATGDPVTKSSVTYIDLAAVSSTATPPTPSIPSRTKITLQAGTGTNDSVNPIFIFRGLTDDGIVLGDINPTTIVDGVRVDLKGVDPNNVFWVSKRGLTIYPAKETKADANGNYPEFNGHLLVGNFLGNNNVLTPTASDTGLSPLQIGENTKVTAGRFLGFTSSNLRDDLPASGGTVPPGSAPPAKTMELWAMNSVPPTYEKYTNQPIMAPVLNIHSPGGNPSSPFGTSYNDRLEANGWIPNAKKSTFNAVFVMGDSPARPIDPTEMGAYTTEAAEGNGGLVNFPRFLERWETGDADNNPSAGLSVNIAGSLIQYKKSVYADAPYESITNPSVDNSLFFDSPVYTSSLANFNGYRYPGGADLGRASYYRSPARAWGFDVGLLSQPADLFSKRFSLPSTARPSEFFREVSRDDTWVKALLCAKVSSAVSVVTPPASPPPLPVDAGKPAVDASQLPSGCS